MNFQIEESEFNTIESVKAQLNLVAGLMVCANERPSDLNALVSPSGIYEFLYAQVESLSRITTSIQDRHEAQRLMSHPTPQTEG
jgi:hypothetical protein